MSLPVARDQPEKEREGEGERERQRERFDTGETSLSVTGPSSIVVKAFYTFFLVHRD